MTITWRQESQSRGRYITKRALEMWIEIHLSLWLNIILHIHRVKLLMVDREKFAEITINLKQSSEITQSRESFQYPISRVEKTP